MEDLNQRYYLRPAAAYVRGKIKDEGPLFSSRLDELTEMEWGLLFQIGQVNGLKMHRFKRSRELPRVSKVLGLLRGFQPENLLDIGTGRGVFLWPFLDEFRDTPVHCLDVLDYRVEDLLAVREGGMDQIWAERQDIRDCEAEEESFDLVTLLETLEHIPNPQEVIHQVCRLARRGVIVSVPSKEDDNPEHIHLFDQASLQELFRQAGVEKVKFTYVLNHLIAYALK
jgi:2-polyprenyl-3-methyl-5-hydroxy-6-metoxy-1,4-benzoquinol methylase